MQMDELSPEAHSAMVKYCSNPAPKSPKEIMARAVSAAKTIQDSKTSDEVIDKFGDLMKSVRRR